MSRMDWLLFRFHLTENAKLIASAVLTVSAIITVVILTVYLMSLSLAVGLPTFLVASWLGVTIKDYIKAKHERGD